MDFFLQKTLSCKDLLHDPSLYGILPTVKIPVVQWFEYEKVCCSVNALSPEEMFKYVFL